MYPIENSGRGTPWRAPTTIFSHLLCDVCDCDEVRHVSRPAAAPLPSARFASNMVGRRDRSRRRSRASSREVTCWWTATFKTRGMVGRARAPIPGIWMMTPSRFFFSPERATEPARIAFKVSAHGVIYEVAEKGQSTVILIAPRRDAILTGGRRRVSAVVDCGDSSLRSE